MQTQTEFSEQLIKGKIAELVFSQMFQNGHKFTVIPLVMKTHSQRLPNTQI